MSERGRDRGYLGILPVHTNEARRFVGEEVESHGELTGDEAQGLELGPQAFIDEGLDELTPLSGRRAESSALSGSISRMTGI